MDGLTVTLLTLFREQIWLSVLLGGSLVLPLLAFATRHYMAPAPRGYIQSLLHCTLLVGSCLILIRTISDQCPFPGGFFHEGRPIFLGAWMIAFQAAAFVAAVLLGPIVYLLAGLAERKDDSAETSIDRNRNTRFFQTARAGGTPSPEEGGWPEGPLIFGGFWTFLVIWVGWIVMGRPYFSVRASMLLLLFSFLFPYLLTAPLVRRPLRGPQFAKEAIVLFFVRVTYFLLLWGPMLWVLAIWLLPFRVRDGSPGPMCAFAIAIHSVRATLVPFGGAICLVAASIAWTAAIHYLIHCRETQEKNTGVYPFFGFLVLSVSSWAAQYVGNSRSFPDCRTSMNGMLSPSEWLATAPSFGRASDWIIVAESLRQSRDAGKPPDVLKAIAQAAQQPRAFHGRFFCPGGELDGQETLIALDTVIGALERTKFFYHSGLDVLQAVARTAGNLRGEERLTVLRAVIAAAREISDETRRYETPKPYSPAAWLMGRHVGLVVLQSVIAAVKDIKDEGNRSKVLDAAASAAGNLDGLEGVTALHAVIAAAKEIDDSPVRSEVLQACREAAAKLQASPKNLGLEDN